VAALKELLRDREQRVGELQDSLATSEGQCHFLQELGQRADAAQMRELETLERKLDLYRTAMATLLGYYRPQVGLPLVWVALLREVGNTAVH
jgi:SMC interacting uncharacterized protein involved in chromosome segregation